MKTDNKTPNAHVVINKGTEMEKLVNPLHTGIGPFHRDVSEEMYVKSALKLIQEIGAEKFLVYLLRVLRSSLNHFDWD